MASLWHWIPTKQEKKGLNLPSRTTKRPSEPINRESRQKQRSEDKKNWPTNKELNSKRRRERKKDAGLSSKDERTLSPSSVPSNTSRC